MRGPLPALPGLRAASPALRAALKKDPSLSPALAALLARSGRLFGCPAEEALFLTGFDKDDATPGRLDAALAELRAADFLRLEGFTDIVPLARSSRPTADLAASRGGALYVFEVRWVGGGFGADAVSKLSDKCARKAVQLGAAMKRSGADAGGLIFVAGLPFGREGRSPALLAEAAEKLSGKAGRGRRHVCLIDGLGSAAYPEWGS
ncbi:MAG: hypothetical protein M0011_06845 [Elusimicrobia bacterium]|nr:hypothetical protein [Elusimicrobiota bacterium]